METADDRKAEEGSPSSLPVDAHREEIQDRFPGWSVPALAAWVVGILAVIVAAAGVILWILPVLIAGVALLGLAALFYLIYRDRLHAPMD